MSWYVLLIVWGLLSDYALPNAKSATACGLYILAPPLIRPAIFPTAGISGVDGDSACPYQMSIDLLR